MLTRGINKSVAGYAGFRTKAHLHKHLMREVFGTAGMSLRVQHDRIDKTEVSKIIKRALRSCSKIFLTGKVKVFIFPSFQPFLRKRMNGVSGYTPHAGTVHIYLSHARGWKQAVLQTVAHEFVHAVTLKHHRWETLLDSLVFEGIAEHFREEAVGGEIAPWSRALNASQSKDVFRGLRKSLHSKSQKLYHSVFFGSEKFPLWAGYAVGYQLVKSFRKRVPQLECKQILRLKPEEILKKSGFNR